MHTSEVPTVNDASVNVIRKFLTRKVFHSTASLLERGYKTSDINQAIYLELDFLSKEKFFDETDIVVARSVYEQDNFPKTIAPGSPSRLGQDGSSPSSLSSSPDDKTTTLSNPAPAFSSPLEKPKRDLVAEIRQLSERNKPILGLAQNSATQSNPSLPTTIAPPQVTSHPTSAPVLATVCRLEEPLSPAQNSTKPAQHKPLVFASPSVLPKVIEDYQGFVERKQQERLQILVNYLNNPVTPEPHVERSRMLPHITKCCRENSRSMEEFLESFVFGKLLEFIPQPSCKDLFEEQLKAIETECQNENYLLQKHRKIYALIESGEYQKTQQEHPFKNLNHFLKSKNEQAENIDKILNEFSISENVEKNSNQPLSKLIWIYLKNPGLLTVPNELYNLYVDLMKIDFSIKTEVSPIVTNTTAKPQVVRSLF